MSANTYDFPFLQELEKSVIQSLATSFGLDLLLFKDKLGGDVDTIHNVRQGIFATEVEREAYAQRSPYDSHEYHQHPNYQAKGRQDKMLQQEGKLVDNYRNGRLFSISEQRNLDHTISAKEIHDDPGRILAGISGVEIANRSSNLQSTLETINKSKKADTTENFLAKIPVQIKNRKDKLTLLQQELTNLPRNTPADQHAARVLEDKIRKEEKAIADLMSIDPEAMRKRDREAREKYNQEVNKKYYTGSKFLKNSSKAAAISGIKMGTRQVLGIVLAEAWFEIKAQIKESKNTTQKNFEFQLFINKIQKIIFNTLNRIKVRFHDFFSEFGNGVFSGIISSLTTTLRNILSTTASLSIKIIRESISHITESIKIIFFNPENLDFVGVCRVVLGLCASAAAAAAGSFLHGHLLPLFNFPFGSELAAFISALITGIIALSLSYFCLHSKFAQKIWDFIRKLMPHAITLESFREINKDLDEYSKTLSLLEFNLDSEELNNLSQNLKNCNSEIEKSIILQEKIEKRNIKLPFDMQSLDSKKKWLKSLTTRQQEI